ncbi:MAG: nitroreductase [Hyphomicrobiaceae bacterium]|nr:nitroreductase [Hyphomicrobiaceae bacterium]
MPLSFLLKRRSVVVARLQEPGPDKDEIVELIAGAIRVPDHKALAPWRFLVFSGAARADFGKKIAAIYEHNVGEARTDRAYENELNRFLRAPVVIGVISSPVDSIKVPQSEQLLSAGAACMNILHGARALGYAAQWVTEWIAYDAKVDEVLHLEPHQSVAGFIYLGSSSEIPGERPRVKPQDVMSYWSL